MPAASESRGREVVEAILCENGADQPLCDGLEALLASRDFRTLAPADQDELLGALAGSPTADAADRLRLLASDATYRAFPTRQEAAAAARGAAIETPSSLVGASGAAAPPRSRPGVFTAGSGVAHGVELAAEIAGAHTLAFGAGLAALPVLAVEMGHGILEAHEHGREWGQNVAFGQGFAGAFGDLMGEPSYRPHNGAAAAGAETAQRVWNDLAPSERVTLQALPAEARAAFVGELARRVEARTIAGR